MKKKFIIGIDEVGRGALAGPVIVAAVAVIATPKSQFLIPQQILNSKFLNPKLKLRDSKKLSSKQREEWFEFIKQQKIPYAFAGVSPKIIDKINISNAANLAAKNALRRLIKNSKLRINDCKIFLDGGLYLGRKTLLASGYTLNSKTIIRGDEKIPAISLASIVAKVSRDKLMKRLHKKYPHYDFINNVGYGVKKHIKAIKKFGYSKIHRKSFHLN